MVLFLWQRVTFCWFPPRPCSTSFPRSSGLPLAGRSTGSGGLPMLGALPTSAGLPTPLPLLAGFPTLFEPGGNVCSPGAAAVGFPVSPTVGSVTTLASEVSSPPLGSEDAPGSALFIVSSTTVASKRTSSPAWSILGGRRCWARRQRFHYPGQRTHRLPPTTVGLRLSGQLRGAWM